MNKVEGGAFPAGRETVARVDAHLDGRLKCIETLASCASGGWNKPANDGAMATQHNLNSDRARNRTHSFAVRTGRDVERRWRLEDVEVVEVVVALAGCASFCFDGTC